MFSVAICDDEPVICTQFERTLDRYVNEGKVKTDVFYSGEKLSEELNKGKFYDLIFLDIELGNINGVEVGKFIRDKLKDEKTKIVFVSSKQEYAMELFAVRPMNFLVKPVKPETIIENVEKAMKLAGMYDDVFEFKYGTDIFRIPFASIIYFESDNRKVIVHTEKGEKELYAKLDVIEKNSPDYFTRIHQSYLVNNMHIDAYRPETLVVSGAKELRISKKYKKTVSDLMLENGGVLL